MIPTARCAYLSWFFGALSCASIMGVVAGPTTASPEASKPRTKAILIASRKDSGRQSVLNEWARQIRGSTVPDMKIWVLCTRETSTEMLVEDLPEILPFFVEEGDSWATVLTKFKAKVKISIEIFQCLFLKLYRHCKFCSRSEFDKKSGQKHCKSPHASHIFVLPIVIHKTASRNYRLALSNKNYLSLSFLNIMAKQTAMKPFELIE